MTSHGTPVLPTFTYVRPASLREAIRKLGSPDARIHAGGTDLVGCLRDRVFTARKLVAIGALKELGGIAVSADGALRVGALATLSEIATHPAIGTRFTALAQAAASAASPQLRSQGTLGGNLCQRPRCWYFRGDFACLRKGGDTCYAVQGENERHAIFGSSLCCMVHPSDTAPALVALDGQVRIAGPHGTRTTPLESFFVLPATDTTRETVLATGEILTDVLVPLPPPGLRSLYRKVRVRRSWDFALAGVALALGVTAGRVDRARVVLSGVAPVPWRAVESEEALVGSTLDAETASRAAAASVIGAEPLAQNGYKVDLVRGLVEEAVLALA
jgi:xanthine dehydrogenase YagS FAD-binding subunit